MSIWSTRSVHYFVALSMFGATVTPAQIVEIDLSGAKAVAKFVDRAGVDQDRGFVRIGRDVAIATPLPDPTTLPTYLRVFSEKSGVTNLALDPSLWRRVRRGYRYDDPDVVSGVRRVAILDGKRGGTIVIRARGSVLGMQPVGEPSSFLEIGLGVGTAEYCARLGPPGAQMTTARPGRLSFRGTATPCEVRTVACPIDPSSRITIRTGLLTFPLAATGSLSFTCAGFDATTMQASCACKATLAPLLIVGIGDVCVAPGPACDAGRFDCAGTVPADVDVAANRNIGICAGNADCASQCDSRCASLGPNYRRSLSACEDYCSGGANDGEPCTADPECPGGLCAGWEGRTDGPICQCSCIATGLGSAPAAASLACNLSLAISIELDEDGVCGSVPPVAILPPQCQAVTSASASAVMDNVANIPGVSIGPLLAAGAPPTCPGLVAGSSAMTLVGHYTAFASVIGDILAESALTCQ